MVLAGLRPPEVTGPGSPITALGSPPTTSTAAGRGGGIAARAAGVTRAGPWETDERRTWVGDVAR
jgi:hypothetical protein